MVTALILGMLLGIIFVVSVIYMFRTMKNIRDAVAGQTYVTVLKKGGGRESLLCENQGEFAMVPKWLHTEGMVALAPDATFDMLYPEGPGWPPKFMRATVRSLVMAEGNPEPWHPYREDPILNDEVIARLKQSKVVEAFVRKGEREFGGVAGKLGIRPVVLYIGLGVIGILCLISVIMGYMAWSGTDKISAGFGM